MSENADRFYRALVARDDRFDGVFFVAVTSTGVYCRPVCSARTPRRDRCRFFPSAAAAEQSGFRPCLRCRPELAPGHAPVDAARRIAHAAAARIEAGALNDGGTLDRLAENLGVCPRQVRRSVRREFGVSPIELAQTHRLLLAKRLLTETQLPAVEIAHASGFGSVRRFNALFRSRYHLTPTQLRRAAAGHRDASSIHLKLAYRPPLAWQPMLDFLAARSTVGVEQVSENRYVRTVGERGHQGWVSVGQTTDRRHLDVELSISLLPVLPRVLHRLKQLFDLNACPHSIDGHLATDPQFAASVRRFPGLRVPGAFDGFELGVRAILGQQISVRAATTLAGRLAGEFGEAISTPFSDLNRLTPLAESIAPLAESALNSLGLTRARSRTVLELARATVSRGLSLEPAAAPGDVVGRLRMLPGIGAWTADYIAMRALRWPDALPHTDLGLLKSLGGIRPNELFERSLAWSPWRAYAAMHLWNQHGEATKVAAESIA